MKTFLVVLWVAVAQFFLIATAAAELSPEQEREIIFDCTQLVQNYAYYRDMHDPENFANIFTEDARMTARGEWLTGREALMDHVMDGDPDNQSMHMVSTVKITPIDEQNATGVTYSSVVYQLTGVAVTGKYFDKFVKTEDGWKISERVWSVIYRNTGG